MKYIAILLLILVVACQQAEVVPDQPNVQPEPDLMQETCSDGIKNQGEAGIDCGGPCPACASCNDYIKNQGETEVDCGGPCPKCLTCDDGIKNQGEVEVDCGGPCKPCDVEYVVKAEEGMELRDKMKPSDKAKFLTNSYPGGLGVGESTTFALAVNNIYTEDNTFWVENEFIKAEDAKTNAISTEETAVLEWLSKNEFEQFTLKQYEVQILPVGITVGAELAPGVATKPGTYYFRAIVKRQKTKLNVEDYIQLDYSIKVK